MYNALNALYSSEPTTTSLTCYDRLLQIVLHSCVQIDTEVQYSLDLVRDTRSTLWHIWDWASVTFDMYTNYFEPWLLQAEILFQAV